MPGIDRAASHGPEPTEIHREPGRGAGDGGEVPVRRGVADDDPGGSAQDCFDRVHGFHRELDGPDEVDGFPYRLRGVW
ncbi:hypothetical protein ACFVYA_03530 [Amycolatopsis sp. NPDC058278]|uniref:hypothetical protein n=1 Tax=Amycolatopsis sp. NPDC058278 TaxID=3346417 RepID=UPI0036D8114C